jgi:hypothetical protein
MTVTRTQPAGQSPIAEAANAVTKAAEESLQKTLDMNDPDTQCFLKAKFKGEPTFTLRAQDRSAPENVCKWITANIETASEKKLRDALEIALRMRVHPHRRVAD